VEHPSGITLKYHYNENFYLSKITNNQSGKLLWELKKVDLNNRVTEEVHGNGAITTYEYDIQDNLTRIKSVHNNVVIHDLQYEYNAINLKTRKIDHKNNITEVYTYDNLNRLTNVSTSGQINEELTMTYDKWGNIKTKSDLGTYHYSSSIPTLLELIDFFEPDCSLPSSKFDYEYTSFNKISKITGDSVSLEITYGPDNQRLIQRMFIHNQLHETRTYVAPDYEIITINNVDTRRMSIPGSGGMAVIYEVTGTQAGKYNYLHKDDQGSVVAITNDAGVVQYSYQYDVWGKRRVTTQVENVFGGTYRGYTGHEHITILELINMNGRIYDPVMARFLSPDPYIGEKSNFQNFNRFSYVYNNPVNFTDPSGYFVKKWFREIRDGAAATIGRIGKGVSAIASGQVRDGFKYFGQAWIDYSFKWHGVGEIDRHGRQTFGEETWNQIVVASATIIVAYGTGGIGAGVAPTLGTAIMSGAAAGFAGGATGAYLSGAGTNDILKSGFKSAVISGVSAGLTHGIGTGIEKAGLKGEWLGEGLRAVGHGAVQGTMSELQGGTFSSGFMSGFVGSVGSHAGSLYGTNPAVRIFSASVVGGTISSITGGKFATGAVSGAFVEMFNQMGDHGSNKGQSDAKRELRHFKDAAEEQLADNLYKGASKGVKTLISVGGKVTGVVDFVRGEGIFFGGPIGNSELYSPSQLRDQINAQKYYIPKLEPCSNCNPYLH
jgi:RHS repeat-associated protein